MSKRLLLICYPSDRVEREKVRTVCDGRIECCYVSSKDENYYSLLNCAEAFFGDITPEELRRANNLCWLQLPCAGVERYISVSRRQGNLLLTNASGAFGVTIAEHAIAMLLCIARRLPEYGLQQRKKIWSDLGSEWTLEGKRALILGTGDLGSQLAIRLRAFGMKTIGFCREPKKQGSLFDDYITSESLDDEIRMADAIFGCLPSTPQTEGLLSRERLLLTKEQAILINVGRGSLLKTEDLLQALDAGKFFGVGLDVTECEPLSECSLLWHAPRVILTPHVSGIGKDHLVETRERIWNIFLDNLSSYLDGKELRNVVDLEQGY